VGGFGFLSVGARIFGLSYDESGVVDLFDFSFFGFIFVPFWGFLGGSLTLNGMMTRCWVFGFGIWYSASLWRLGKRF